MESRTRIVSPGPQERTVRTAEGEVLKVPIGWVLLPPGDPGATRRFKAAGPTWTLEQRKGRKRFSLGVWGPGVNLERIQRELAAERSTEAYAKRRASDSARRERKQEAYVEDFQGAVLQFLGFHERFLGLAQQLAAAVTAHATPVGSGTVARTERIPIERRAESAVIAWMRHQTTAYDSLRIPRVRGARREVRQQLAQQSRRLLARYRSGEATVRTNDCPLMLALQNPKASSQESAAAKATPKVSGNGKAQVSHAVSPKLVPKPRRKPTAPAKAPARPKSVQEKRAESTDGRRVLKTDLS